MKKLFIIPAVLLIILFNVSTVHSAPSLSNDDIVSICGEVFDALIPNQAALSDKSYIAIDMNYGAIKNLPESSKLQIFNSMRKYEINHLTVLNSSIDDLKAKGLASQDNALNYKGIRGIFLSISSVDIMQNGDAVVVCTWYCDSHSAKDAQVILRKNGANWQVVDGKTLYELQ